MSHSRSHTRIQAHAHTMTQIQFLYLKHTLYAFILLLPFISFALTHPFSQLHSLLMSNMLTHKHKLSLIHTLSFALSISLTLFISLSFSHTLSGQEWFLSLFSLLKQEFFYEQTLFPHWHPFWGYHFKAISWLSPVTQH